MQLLSRIPPPKTPLSPPDRKACPSPRRSRCRPPGIPMCGTAPSGPECPDTRHLPPAQTPPSYCPPHHKTPHAPFHGTQPQSPNSSDAYEPAPQNQAQSHSTSSATNQHPNSSNPNSSSDAATPLPERSNCRAIYYQLS